MSRKRIYESNILFYPFYRLSSMPIISRNNRLLVVFNSLEISRLFNNSSGFIIFVLSVLVLSNLYLPDVSLDGKYIDIGRNLL